MTRVNVRFFMGNYAINMPFLLEEGTSLEDATGLIVKKIKTHDYLYNHGGDITEVIACKHIQYFEIQIEHS